MKQQEKQILLKDLCARLPYGINLYVEEPKKLPDNEHISVGFIGGYALDKEQCQDFSISEILESLDNGSIVKPYLRPISSMTEEEKKEYKKLQHCFNDTMLTISLLNNWLNEHHFDYNGLIEKGLAFEAPEGMYKN